MFLTSKSRYKLVGYFFLFLLLFLIFYESVATLFIVVSRSLKTTAGQSEEIEDLKIENMVLSLKIEELDSLAKENERLRKALALKEENNITVISGRIWGFSPSSWRRIAFCSAGERQNVQKNSLVITEGKLLVGKVLDVFDHYCTLLLVNDPYFSLPVLIEEKGMGLLQGRLSGDPQILYVEEQQEVAAGDSVRATSEKIPFTLRVGRISNVTQSPDDFFLNVEAAPDVQIHTVTDVFIIQ